MTGNGVRDPEDTVWLGALIAALPDEPPPPGWQADVRRALAAERREPAATRRRWVPGTGAALAFAAAAVVLLRAAPVTPVTPVEPIMHVPPEDGALSIRVVRHGAHDDTPGAAPPGDIVRGAGGDAALGDMLRVEAPAGAGELRIYRDDRDIVLRCPGDGCTPAGSSVVAQLRIRAPGVYRAVVLQLPEARWFVPPVIPVTGTLAGDADACRCTARTSVPIIAR